MRARHVFYALVAIAASATICAPPSWALSGCSPTAASAIDQYCESFPTANGGSPTGGPQTGGPGGSAPLATTLPHRFVRSVLHSGAHSRSRLGLLAIPSRYRDTPISGVGSLPATSGWSVISTLVLIVVGIGLVLAFTAVLARRRLGRATPG